MLAYVLAFVVGLGSFSLYMAAFFLPEVHRRNDFLWSGVGLFYALVLWVCADRMTGGVLLGQVAGVSLLGWLGWQLVLLRRQIAPLDQQTPLPTADELKATLSNVSNSSRRSQLTSQASQFFGQITGRVQGAIATVTSRPGVEVLDEPYVPPSLEEFGTAGKEATERFARAAIVDAEVVDVAGAATVQPQITQTAENIADQAVEVAQTAENRQETGRSRSPGWGKKKEGQAPYVRKQFREGNPGAESPLKLESKPEGKPEGKPESKPESKPEGKPVYVRKQFRDQDAGSNAAPKNAGSKNAGSKEGKPVYVRKQYREPEPEQIPTVETTAAKLVVEPVEISAAPVGSEATLAETPIPESPVPESPFFETPFFETPLSETTADVLQTTVVEPGIFETASETASETVSDIETSSFLDETTVDQGTIESNSPNFDTLNFDGLEPGILKPDILEPDILEPDIAESTVGENFAPDLLGAIPPTVTAEDIVEELLEDISAQEEGASPADIIAELEQGTVAKERLKSFYGDVTDNSDQ